MKEKNQENLQSLRNCHKAVVQTEALHSERCQQHQWGKQAELEHRMSLPRCWYPKRSKIYLAGGAILMLLSYNQLLTNLLIDWAQHPPTQASVEEDTSCLTACIPNLSSRFQEITHHWFITQKWKSHLLQAVVNIQQCQVTGREVENASWICI